MANNNIPFKELEKKPLETRIYALMLLYQTAERLQTFNGNLKEEDNIKISNAVISFVQGAVQGDASKDEESVIDKFPKLMDIALTENPDEQQKMAREFLQNHQDMAFTGNDSLFLIATDTCNDVKLTKTFEEINTIVLKSTQGKKSSYTPEDMAHSVTTGEFANDSDKIETVSKKLQQAKKDIKERLIADWMNYKASGSHKLDGISMIIEKIAGRVDVSYQTKFPKSQGNTQVEKNRNNSPKQKAGKRVRAYFSKSSGALYNQGFPDTKITEKPGSKEDFLKIMGIFIHCGRNHYHSSLESIQTDYAKLKMEVSRLYPENSEEALNRILNIKEPEKLTKAELDQARQSNFAEKSRELYIKTLSATLAKKNETSKGDFSTKTFVERLLRSYIQEMADKGENNVLYISTIDANAETWNQVNALKKEQFEQMISTVHHHRPVASTLDFYLMLHPEELQKGETIDTLSEKRALELADKAQEYANNIGNHCLVFGSDVHDLLEAKGFYSVSDKKESTVLACSYDSKEIIQLLQSSSLDKNTIEKLCEDVVKYGKQKDKDGITRCTIDFPDHPEVEKLQKSLSTERNSNIEQEISKLMVSYAKQGNKSR